MPGSADVLLSARTFPAGSSALEMPRAKSVAHGAAAGPHVSAIPELATAFWTFPRDHRLCQIEALLRPSRDLSAQLDGAWVRSHLVGYAPGKSAVVACLGAGGAPVGYAKLYATPHEAGRAFHLHADIWKTTSARTSVRLPRPLALVPTRHVVISEVARGTRLTDLSPVDAGRGAALLGKAIAQFHAMAVPPMAQPFGRTETASLRRAASLIGRARPDLRASAAKLAGDLAASAPGDTGTVLLHGDLHLKNALVDVDGLWLIDLDQAASGPAAADIGSFLALLRSRAVAGLLAWNDFAELEREFVGAYGEVRRLPPQRVIDWHTSAALVGERALRAISRVRLPMLARLEALVDEAERVFRKGGDQ
jgi:Ser/Thr protein kinase RdoA (MazF antagonist)